MESPDFPFGTSEPWRRHIRDTDLKTLRLFVAVCDHRNIAQAAAEAHIEPSAISKRIAQLESELGVPLLSRARRGVQPTAAGVALLEHARNVLFTMERMVSDVAAFGGGLKGRVSVCASVSAIAETLLDDIASFMREPEYQNIRVDTPAGRHSSRVTHPPCQRSEQNPFLRPAAYQALILDMGGVAAKQNRPPPCKQSQHKFQGFDPTPISSVQTKSNRVRRT